MILLCTFRLPGRQAGRCHLDPRNCIYGVVMEVQIRHLGNVRFEASARGHRVFADQPVENGGSDGGMTPPELLLAALGTCAGHYAAQYLKSRSLAAEGLEVRVSAEKAAAAGAAGCIPD